MKKLFSFILVVALIAAGVVLGPRLVHKCADCETFFLGTGYYPNVVEELVGNGDQVICKACAEKQHAIAITLGKDVSDFQRELFENTDGE